MVWHAEREPGLMTVKLDEGHSAHMEGGVVMQSSRDLNPGQATHLRASSALEEVNSLTCPKINGVDVEAASELGHPPGERVVVEAAPGGVRRVAVRDTCTSLPTRTLFRERLDGELARSKPPGRVRALFYLDLDGFTAIKDAYGSGTGDELLQIVGARLTRALRTGDTVSRIGDGEFACLLGATPSRLDLAHVACKLFDAMESPLTIRDLKIALRPSIGIAIYPHDGPTADLLLENANEAMARAKEREAGYAFFDERALA